jgi:hypothetical protein
MHFLRTVTLATLALPAVGGPLLAQTPKQWNERAASGRESPIFYFYAYQGISASLCTGFGLPPVKLVEPPQNGAARIAETDFIPKGCPNPIKATGIFYRPNPGFVGTDRFTVEKGPQGGIAYGSYEGTNVFNVTVK